jgi:hypothetical protein
MDKIKINNLENANQDFTIEEKQNEDSLVSNNEKNMGL